MSQIVRAVHSERSLTKADVGLGSVDNTPDLAKPISEAAQFALDSKAGRREVREYTASQSSIPTPSGIAGAYVSLISGGGGGGSGRRGAAGTVRCGGGGGATVNLHEAWIPASAWSSTYSVVVGAGGAGGAAVFSDDTNGNAGTNGTASSVQTGSIFVRTSSPSAGSGGTASAGSGGGAGTGTGSSVGAAASTSGGAGALGGSSALGAGGGGSGGGVTTGNAANNGGAGGSVASYGGASPAGGVVDTTAAGNGVQQVSGLPGSGGGGGAASITTAGQSGGTGGPYGGGGGGGGASVNGFTSGAGGAGASGFVRVTFVYGNTWRGEILNGADVDRNGVRYRSQTANQTWSLVNIGGADRFEVRPGDRPSFDVIDVERSELYQLAGLSYGTEVWLSYAFNLQAAAIDTAWCLIGQFHDGGNDPGEVPRAPMWAMELTTAGALRVSTRSDPNAITTAPIPLVSRWTYTGFQRDTWYRFVWRLRFEKTGNGLMQGWRDGVEVYPETAIPIGFNDIADPYFKYGIYRAAGSSTTYVARVANVEVGTTSLLSRVTSPLALPTT
jgi:hypothetical protein